MSEDCWHKAMEPVHHSHLKCHAGQAARGKYHRTGTGGKPLCSECARLHVLDGETSSDDDAAPNSGPG